MLPVIKGQLLCKETDIGGYVTYVFKNLDKASFGQNYLMLTRWYNWEHRPIDIGEIGYVEYQEVHAGVDTYYDRISDSMVKYNYNNLIFIKFIKEQDNSNKNIIL